MFANYILTVIRASLGYVSSFERRSTSLTPYRGLRVLLKSRATSPFYVIFASRRSQVPFLPVGLSVSKIPFIVKQAFTLQHHPHHGPARGVAKGPDSQVSHPRPARTLFHRILTVPSSRKPHELPR